MDSRELPPSQKSFKRFKQTLYKQLESRDNVEVGPETDINSSSAFLQLPVELRILIYKYAFARSPAECFESIHHKSKANPASGLMLTCRQTMKESLQIYYQDVVVSLWQQAPPNALTNGNVILNKNPILRSWLQSRNGIALKQHPNSMQQLALLIDLKRETKTMCENFIDAEILRNSLRIKDIYIRVCICGTLKWLYERPKDVIPFCIALEKFASHFSTLERIHILYCGQKWPTWIPALGDVQFPEMIFAMQEIRAVSGGSYNIRRSGEKELSGEPTAGPDSSQVEPTASLGLEDGEDLCRDICRLRTVMTRKSEEKDVEKNTQQTLGKHESVDINYYDSWTVLKERCVRNKPSQPKEKNVPKKSKLATEPTRLERNVTRVKDFIEAAPLAPTWGFYKYMPLTKDVGKETHRGSHWRRY